MSTNYNPKIAAIVLAASSIFSVTLLVYCFNLRAEIKILQQKQVELLESSLKKENQIKKLEEEVKMQEFRSAHLQELLDQEKSLTQEALKKLKWKQ